MRSLLLLFFTSAAFAAEPYPTIPFKNGDLSLTVMRPDAETGFYRGSRFDWSGVIREVKFNTHTFFKPWKDTHNPANHDDITGPCEEFRTPLGYGDAKEGETFLKIGVGTLVKPKEKDYRFAFNYPIKNAGEWTIAKSDDAITFKQGLLTESGYGYRYEKTLTLLNDIAGFSIRHELANAGTKPISTDWYNHNFFNLDGAAIDANLTLHFPFAPKAKAPKEKFESLVAIKGRTVSFTGDFGSGSIYSELEGYGSEASHHAFAIHHAKSKATMSVTCDEPASKFLLWGVRTTICPEPYIKIDLKPGETKTWTLTYRFTFGPPPTLGDKR